MKLHSQFPFLISVVQWLCSIQGGQSCFLQLPPFGVVGFMLQQLSLGLCVYKIELPRAELTTCKVTMAVRKHRHLQSGTFRLNTINKLYCKKNGVCKSYALLSLIFSPLRKRDHYNSRTKPKDDRSYIKPVRIKKQYSNMKYGRVLNSCKTLFHKKNCFHF